VGKYRKVNAFHVIGGLFAAWAVILAALGITREDFPRAGPQTVAVGTLSVLLAVSAIGSGIITSALEEEEEEGEAAGQPAEGEGGGRTLRLSADPGGELRFDARTLEARAGPVTIQMENPSSVPHNVSIEGSGVDEEGKTVGKGGTSTVRAELQRGQYDFYCSVAGHRQGGMEGTLTVRAP
jgi:plastocyanin